MRNCRGESSRRRLSSGTPLPEKLFSNDPPLVWTGVGLGHPEKTHQAVRQLDLSKAPWILKQLEADCPGPGRRALPAKKGRILVQVAVLVDLNRLYGTQTNREFVTGVPPFTDPKERLLLHEGREIARRGCR